MIVFPTHIKEKSRSGSSWRCWSLENNIDTFFLEIRGPLWLSRLQSLQLCGMFRSKFVKFLCSAPCLFLIIRNTCIVNKNGASVYCIHCQPYMYTGWSSEWCPGIGFLSRRDREIGVLWNVEPPTRPRLERLREQICIVVLVNVTKWYFVINIM